MQPKINPPVHTWKCSNCSNSVELWHPWQQGNFLFLFLFDIWYLNRLKQIVNIKNNWYKLVINIKQEFKSHNKNSKKKSLRK